MDAVTMSERILCVLLLFGISLASPEECQHCNASMPLQFSDIVPKDYDKSKPPLTADGEPTVVRIKVSVLNIQFVDEEMQTFGADIFIHQYWTDNRVKIPAGFTAKRIVVDPNWRKKLWTPDTYFKNLLDGKVNDIIIPYSYAKLDNKSELFFANRVTLKLICPMNLAKYPHDVQECEISIMSLQHSTSTVKLEWSDFEVTKTILLAQYRVMDRSRADCTKKIQRHRRIFLPTRQHQTLSSARLLPDQQIYPMYSHCMHVICDVLNSCGSISCESYSVGDFSADHSYPAIPEIDAISFLCCRPKHMDAFLHWICFLKSSGIRLCHCCNASKGDGAVDCQSDKPTLPLCPQIFNCNRRRIVSDS